MSSGKNKNKNTPNKTKTLIVVIIAISVALLAALGLIIGKPFTEEQPVPVDDYYPITSKKPVLYLYPTEETDVTISFAKPSQLTTTYPKYYGGWNVKAMPDGSLYDINGNYYYALYWEEQSALEADQSSAFYVTKDGAIDFLEDALNYIGLNDKERNEFIMYWLPVLEQNEQSLVRFSYTEEFQADNELKITPSPDSLIRIRVYVEKVSQNPNLPEPALQHFERNGFTVVEWGGSKQ